MSSDKLSAFRKAPVEITALLPKAALALAGASCLILASAAMATAQQAQDIPGRNEETNGKEAPAEQQDFNKQDVMTSLRLLADEIKDEDDRGAASVAQARIADAIWEFDEQAARAVFRRAFDGARKPAEEADSKSKSARATAARRQAYALREVLRRFSRRDGAEAERWLKQFEKEQASEPQSTRQPNPGGAEMLGQIALEMSGTDQQRSLELGLLSLSGKEIPSTFGQLLFALSRSKDRAPSNALFAAAISTMRRSGYAFNPAINALSNYLFDARGRLFRTQDASNANLLIKYFFDAAQAHAALQRGGPPVRGEAGDSAAQLFTFLSARALPITAANAAADLPQMQALLRELSSGLSQQQLQHAAAVTSSVQPPASSLDQQRSDMEARIRQAEGERAAATRDDLWRGIAIDLISGEPDRALTIAAKIGDEFTRRLTEDDIRLAVVSEKIRGQAYLEAREITAKLNDNILRAKVLAQLADRTVSDPKNKDTALAGELLSEAYTLVQKGDHTPDKVQVLLILAARIAKIDSGRGFEVLLDVVKAANQFSAATADDVSPTFSGKRPSGLLVVRYAMVGGREFTTGERATIDSIEFSEVGQFVKLNYVQTKMAGEAIRNKFLRARFLIAMAEELSKSSPRRASPATPAQASN